MEIKPGEQIRFLHGDFRGETAMVLAVRYLVRLRNGQEITIDSDPEFIEPFKKKKSVDKPVKTK